MDQSIQTQSQSSVDSQEPKTGIKPRRQTSTDWPFEALTIVQLAALGWLAEGKTISATAEEVGINRETLTRWIRNDVAFRAAYNQWRAELIESTRSRLLLAAENATAAVHNAINRGDGRLALSLLKHLGLAAQATAGPTDQELVENEIAVAGERERSDLHQSAVDAGRSEISVKCDYWRLRLRELHDQRATAKKEERKLLRTKRRRTN